MITKKQVRHFLLYAEQFPVWMHRLGYAATTIESYTRQLKAFLRWLEEQGIESLSSVSQEEIERYSAYLHHKVNKNSGGGLASSYIEAHLNVIRLLDKYLQLSGEGKVLHGKVQIVPGLKQHRPILTQAEIQQLYSTLDQSVLGYRDRAILAIYYGCGLRSAEGERVKEQHLHYEKGLLQVLPGKNYQGRYVPMSAGVMEDLRAYQRYSRPYLGPGAYHQLLLGTFGRPMRGVSMSARIHQLVIKAGINKSIGLHSLRHSIATHLLQGGMPLEQISRFLGHTSLDSTQIYTRLKEELEHEISQ